MSLTFLPLPNYREAEIRIHFNWNTSLALDDSPPKCSCYRLIWLHFSVPNLQRRGSSYWSLKGLAINPYVHHSHKAVRARVHLLDAPNIPLSPHCTDNNDNISKLPTNCHYRSTTSVLIQSVVSILSSMISSTHVLWALLLFSCTFLDWMAQCRRSPVQNHHPSVRSDSGLESRCGRR